MKNKLSVSNAITAFRGTLEQNDRITSQQKGVFTTLQQCRTPALGGHVKACPKCGHVQTGYNSCRNRHCPTCNNIKRERWILERRSEMLPVDYFHVVFTLPDSLNGLCLYQPKLLYGLLFKSAWATLQQFAANHRHLGAKAGMIAVLHTWGQNLQLHPHLHCLVFGRWNNTAGQMAKEQSSGEILVSSQSPG